MSTETITDLINKTSSIGLRQIIYQKFRKEMKFRFIASMIMGGIITIELITLIILYLKISLIVSFVLILLGFYIINQLIIDYIIEYVKQSIIYKPFLMKYRLPKILEKNEKIQNYFIEKILYIREINLNDNLIFIIGDGAINLSNRVTYNDAKKQDSTLFKGETLFY